MHSQRLSVAVLIPCHNEETTITTVVDSFRRTLPEATIFVYDNNSTDRTVELALAAGAIVRTEPLQGKGNVVRRMFADIDADVYVLIDGDATYDSASIPLMIDRLVTEPLDMVNGARVPASGNAYRAGHKFGNHALSGIVRSVFGSRIRDMLSGLRVFSRRFVKSFPALSSGFEIETELTVHALELRMPVAEIDTPYNERPTGSVSKLSTFRDGFCILRTIINLIREERPLQFFSALSICCITASVLLGIPVITEFIETGLVPRFPTAILATGIMLLGFIFLASGLILETVKTGRREMKRMHYLSIPATTLPGVEPYSVQRKR